MNHQSAPAQQLLREVLMGHQPTQEEAADLFGALIAGDFHDIEISALLATLRTRAETAAELAGAAQAFLAAAITVPTKLRCLDSAGTGGDRAGTINISTAAALAVASQGVKMAKHGNRSVSSLTGSADVLQALGVPVDLTPQQAAQSLETHHFAFLFAPNYHPAIARVMTVRRTLAVPTLFNLIGPILAPAPLKAQLMGVANPEVGELVAQTLAKLDRPHALVVTGSGLDEIAVHGPTQVWEIREGEVDRYQISPQDMGLTTHSLTDLKGGEPQVNAQILRQALSGQGNRAQRDAIASNAGALAYLDGRADNLKDAVQWAGEVVDSGVGAQHLEHLATAGCEVEGISA